MQALYYGFLFIGSIILLLSTFSFVLPFNQGFVTLLHTLAKWILYGFIAEFLVGLFVAKNKLHYVRKEWISFFAIVVSVSLETLTGFLGAVKLAKLAKLIKSMKSLKGAKAVKSLKGIKFVKTVKLGKKTKKQLVSTEEPAK